MLETKATAAEQLVSRIKKQKQKENTDYVHPRNDIHDGFIVVNYQKRNIVSKSVMDERIEMLMPEEWTLLQWEKNQYIYGFPKEKEVFVLTQTELSENDWKKMLEEIGRQYKEDFVKGSSGSVITANKQSVKYEMLTGSRRMFLVLFQFDLAGKNILGMFLSHGYRRKTWEKILPQLLAHITIKGKEEKAD